MDKKRALLGAAICLCALAAMYATPAASPEPSLAVQSRGLEVVAKALGGDYAQIGKQYLVLIGIDTYKEWMPLKNPVKDAKELKDILTSRYYIDQVYELYDADATKANLLRLFDTLVDTVQSADSVLIYYAGHGHLDRTNTGFWIPVDAGTDSYEQKNWIPNIQIRNTIGMMKARHVALISDSCFSGDILDPTRGATPTIDQAYYKDAFSRISRQVLTSGASESVPDQSEFAQQLKLALQGNTQPYLDTLGLYSQIRLGMTQTTPLFGDLKESGHQAGASFLLFLKGSVAGGTTAPAASVPMAPASATQASMSQASSGTADLSITTSVEGAEVFVDGVSYGKAPTLASGLSAGKPLTVSAKAGGYSGSMDVTLQPKELRAVSLKLERMKGNLLVTSSEKEVEVFIDGASNGALGSGVYRDLPAGDVSLELKGAGLYFRSTVSIKGEETIKVEAEPWAVGSIRYSAPDNAFIAFTGPKATTRVKGPGVLENLPIGSYSVQTDDIGYGAVHDSVVVAKGETASFTLPAAGTIALKGIPSNVESVQLDGTRKAAPEPGADSVEFLVQPGRVHLVTYLFKRGSSSPAESVQADPGSRTELRAPSGRIAFEWLPKGTIVSVHGAPCALQENPGALPTTDTLLAGDYDVRVSMPALGTYADTVEVADGQVLTLTKLTGFLVDRLHAQQKSRRSLDTVGWVSLGLGALGAAGAGTTYVLGSQARSAYARATATTDISADRSMVEFYGALLGISTGLCGTGLGLSPILFLGGPRKKAIDANLESLNAQIEALKD